MIEVLSTLALNTVQDGGRGAGRAQGLSPGGVMDRVAWQLGNALVGNPPEAAVIELQTFPFALRLHRAGWLAVTGADAPATLDGRPLLPWWRTPVQAGQVLRVAAPRRGARAYLALAGGIALAPVLGARGTDLRGGFGGWQGRALQRGDRLPLGEPGLAPGWPAALAAAADAAGAAGAAAAAGWPGGGPGLVPPGWDALPAAAARGGCARAAAAPGASPAALPTAHPTAPPTAPPTAVSVRVLRAVDFERYAPEVQARFWAADWLISAHSNRTGYRLSGPPLPIAAPLELRSYGVVPGLVQVPPGGQPIVQLADANTAGGYPRLATVIDADLWRLAQLAPGARVRFVDCSVAEARRAHHQARARLAGCLRALERASAPAAAGPAPA